MSPMPIERSLQPPPARIVEGGATQFGTFDAPIPAVNLIDAQPFALPLPRGLRWARLKEWQAFQFGDDRVFFNVALFNAKTLALAQVKAYDRRAKRKHLFERKLAPWALRAPTQVLDSRMAWTGRDGASIRFHTHMDAGRIEVELELPGSRDCPPIEGAVTAWTADAEPQVVSIPFAPSTGAPTRGMVSHKGCFGLSGAIELDGERFEFTRERAFLLMDDHKGYYPYVMRWDWVTGGGVDERGRKIGFNLTRNASLDPARYNENCVWVDGKLHLLPPIELQRMAERSPEVWTVRDAEGKVAVDFEIELDGYVRVNALIAESRYRGPFGSVRGTLELSDGERIRVDGMFGMAEDFHLRC